MKFTTSPIHGVVLSTVNDASKLVPSCTLMLCSYTDEQTTAGKDPQAAAFIFSSNLNITVPVPVTDISPVIGLSNVAGPETTVQFREGAPDK